MRTILLIIVLAAVAVVGCSGDTTAPEPEPNMVRDKADPGIEDPQPCGEACAPLNYCILDRGHTGAHRCP